MAVEDARRPRLYEDLATWWPLLSPPSEYREESALYLRLLQSFGSRHPRTLLELGSGGGNNAVYLKNDFACTLVDRAPNMLDVSRELNPECAHVEGDMRTIRLERTFDRIFIHDAICYMVTEADLLQALRTAFVHCARGGAALFVPDFVRETFAPGTEHGGTDVEGRGLRYLEWTYDPDPSDTHYNVDYAYILRDADGSVRVELDRHVEGLFGADRWRALVTEAGFAPADVPYLQTSGNDEIIAFVAVRPA